MTDPNEGSPLALWSLTMMRRAYRQLAVNFAACDANATERALDEIENSLLRDLEDVRSQVAEHIGPDESRQIASTIARSIREMTRAARQGVIEARPGRLN